MKRSTTLLLPVLLVLASCGTTAQYSQQRFPDSIYLKPGEEPQVVRLYSEEDFENMAAANIARKNGRDTLVVILDDPWDLAWNYRYNYVSPWVLGGLGFSSYYWNRYYSGWYDPFFYSFSPWYSRGYYSGWYDPWYYSMYDPWYYDLWYGGYGYGWYGHRYGWYDNPYYSGGYWGGGGSYRGRDIVYTPRSNTQVSRTRERRPGSGTNTRYGTPGSAGSTSLTRNNGTRPATRSTTGSSTSSSTVRTREQGYNPSRTYSNKNNSGSSTTRSSSGTTTRSSSGSNSKTWPFHGLIIHKLIQ